MNNANGYIIGDSRSQNSNGFLFHSNGIKSEYKNVIESIVVPRTNNNIKNGSRNDKYVFCHFLLHTSGTLNSFIIYVLH